MNARWALAALGGGAMLLRSARRHARRTSFQDASVVITGGRGLGLGIARAFAGEGARLTLLARDDEELERARRELTDLGADVEVAVCDVRDREAVERSVSAVLASRGRIDVLVNNAGIIQVGPEAHQTMEDFEDALGVHFWGALHTMRAVIPSMKQAGAGRIVNIASFAGLVAVPHLLPYSASKHALVGLSDGMRAELAGHGIYVTTVCPGLMRTGSHVNALFKGQQEKEFAWFAIGNAFPLASVSLEHAAARIVEAARYGRARIVISIPAKLAHGLNTLAPELTAALLETASRFLPDPTGPEGDHLRSGFESTSDLSPSPLTHLSDREVIPNNEFPAEKP